MKIAFIPTIHTLETDNTDYHLALTHLVLKYSEYAEFYKKKREQGDFVILDNSLIELGKAASLHKVLEAAKQAGYAISDDFNGYMQDGFGTFDVTIKNGVRFGAGRGYLNEAKKRKNVNIFIKSNVNKI